MSETTQTSSPRVQDLYRRAATARGNSYAPYSRCHVGAAIRLSDGSVFTGSNVENSSFGATICAERSAIVAAVSAVGTIEIVEVMVVTDAPSPWPPCGLCRQVIAEFGPHCTVYAANTAGDILTLPFEELYTHPFGPEQMHR
ncbi:MAG TPA: cytidine deaminase [Armatimonadota bacterium]|jgi:cytidine deaminase